MTPKISIIMSVFNENIEQLQKSIDSILRQIFSDFEFIIILDNPDNRKAKDYIHNKQKSDSRIIFLENKTNIKLGASLNRGINRACGKYIARMDTDDTCDDKKLLKQYRYLEEHPKIDLLFTGWEQIDEMGNISIRIPSKQNFEDIKKTFFYKSPILHASMMCKKEVFENYKYPEIDRPEDFALFLQLISAGFIFDILEENLYTYFVCKKNKEGVYKKIKVFSENYVVILSKNILSYWNNLYFWFRYFLVLFEWLLSRNEKIFQMLYGNLQKIYIKIFL